MEIEELDQIRKDVDAGVAREASVRELLTWFGSYKRGRHIVARIRYHLRKHDLATHPDFDATWIDGRIRFERRSSTETHLLAPVVSTTSEVAAPVFSDDGPPRQPAVASEAGEHAPPVAQTLEAQDPSFSVRKLLDPNKVPVVIAPNTSIREAVTLMLAHDYSQLPVMQGARNVRGLLSWRSLGSRLALGNVCGDAHDAMDPVRTISSEASIFQVAEILASDDVVLVQESATDPRIVGIVTATDVARQFGSLGEPFLLLGEIENRLRVLLDQRLSKEDLRNAKDPDDAYRQIESAADLTFGEYVRLLQAPQTWEKCRLSVDRGVFVKQLENAREVRNDVMHFEPEGIGDEGLRSLRQFAKFLARVTELCL